MNYPTMTDNPSEATTYNGWSNYETWNIALYINNEYELYCLARDWVKHQQEMEAPISYDLFRHTLTELKGARTPDGVRWNDSTVDKVELTEMLMEFMN